MVGSGNPETGTISRPGTGRNSVIGQNRYECRPKSRWTKLYRRMLEPRNWLVFLRQGNILLPSRKSTTEDSQNGEYLQIGRHFVLVAWRTLHDRWVPNEVGQALRHPSFWHRGAAQSAVFRGNPFSMYLGHMGDGESSGGEAVDLQAASPRVMQLCRRPTVEPAA